ncbi:MAG: molybdopterin oxidoreductase family protein [Proteobacteria bacterium]|nr:molybdopterin oxidoreductase family protein [Pseudomonadota bacterium]MBI3498024.1 molybdopterin oxidoreductase family protein [Pseudomonadota bacterium]
MPLDIVPSVCPHDCPSTCLLEVERIDTHTIGRVHGAAANSYTAGVICAKTARYAERVHHPDRLAKPLLRQGAKGEGSWREIGWEDALDLAAERFAEAARRHGAESVWPYYYAGTMGLVMRDGINRLRHVMGYSRQKTTICNTLCDSGWVAGYGAKRGLDPREMAESDLIVMWGGNPVATQVNVMTHVTRARRERQAKFVVVDPYRTATAAVADMHLKPRPGTDGALAAAVMHVLYKEGFADKAYLARYTDASPALEAHLAERTPEWASSITGLAVAEILAFARLYGATKRSFLRIGYGFSRSRNGAAQVHAASCLPAVTGAWAYPGGGALYSNSALYGWNKTMIEGLDRLDPGVRELDMSRIGPVLAGEPEALAGGPPVKAMLIQNTNPATVAPESLKVKAGFRREDLFVVVHEQFMTETAKLADLVLPATTFLEHDDLYQGGGHTHAMVAPKVIEPYAEARSNHEVLQGLARRLGAEHPGFAMSAWEIIDWTLRQSGYPDAETVKEQRWIDRALPFETAHFLDGFPTPDKKFHFAPDWAAIGAEFKAMPPLPDHLDNIDKATAERPFRLVTAPARQFLNTSFTETPGSRKREGRPTALVHPEDCRRIGLKEGGKVRLGNDQASVVVHVRVFDGLQPGVVVVESIWPDDAFEEKLGINALISADAGLPDGGAVFHDTAVWLRTA